MTDNVYTFIQTHLWLFVMWLLAIYWPTYCILILCICDRLKLARDIDHAVYWSGSTNYNQEYMLVWFYQKYVFTGAGGCLTFFSWCAVSCQTSWNINEHKVWHFYIVSVLMKSEKQCRGMWFHFDLMQIYNANRPTMPQNYFIYTHQTTKEFYIHIHVRYKHKS